MAKHYSIDEKTPEFRIMKAREEFGCCWSDTPNNWQEFKLLQTKAKWDKDAQFSLGKLYQDFIENWAERGDLSFKEKASFQQKVDHYFQLASAHGDSKTQYDIASAYYWGGVCDQRISYYYELAAAQGAIEAYKHLVDLYTQGRGVKRSTAKARYYFQKFSQETPPVDDEISKRNQEYLFNDLEKKIAFSLLQDKAERGDVKAQCKIAYDYYHGYNSLRDFEKSLQYYAEAASLGCIEGFFNLGKAFARGKGVAKNIEIAKIYFKQAFPKRGMILSCLGEVYLSDPENNDLREKEDYDANDHWGTYDQGEHFFEWGEWKLALEEFEKAAARHKDVRAEYAIGFMLEKGMELESEKLKVDKNLDKALRFYKKAAKRNYPDALLAMAELSEDQEKAAHYYRRAVKAGSAGALYKMAQEDHEKGDFAKALEIYSQVAKSCYIKYKRNVLIDNLLDDGFLECQNRERFLQALLKEKAFYELGFLYENGRLFPKDIKKACYYYQLMLEEYFELWGKRCPESAYPPSPFLCVASILPPYKKEAF